VSDTQAVTGQAAIDHMVRLLRMNPVHQGAEIIDARREALDLATEAKATRSPPAEEVRALRRKVLDQLVSLRSRFWAMPIDDLNKQLGALDNQGFVDLEVSIARLRIVAAYRDQFPALSQTPGFDGDFFSVLKDVLIRSPRDTAVIREQLLSSFLNRSRRKRGRRMVALLKTEMPAIYELESDWFDTLYRQKGEPRVPLKTGNNARAGTGAGGSKSDAGSYWWVIWIAVGVCSSLSRSFVNDKHNTYDYRPSKTPSIQDFQVKPIEVTPREGVRPNVEESKAEIFLGRDKDGSELYSTPRYLQLRPGSKAPDSFDDQDPLAPLQVPGLDGPGKTSDDQYSR
jgi:hypothetical protein